MAALLSWLVPGSAGAQPVAGDSTRSATPSQFEGLDSAASAMASDSLSGRYRLLAQIRRDSLAMLRYLDSLDHTPMAVMRRNLTFSYRDYAPSAAEMALRDEEIKRSQGWDKVFLNIPRVGVSIPLKSIGQALGLVEDVTPVIKYTLLRTERVTVKIYDLSASLVVVMFDAVQSPGQYRLEWDFLDAKGLRAETGNYVAEVIMEAKDGRQLLHRKRIEVP